MHAIASALDHVFHLSQHRIAKVSPVDPGMQLNQIANSAGILPPPLHSRKMYHFSLLNESSQANIRQRDCSHHMNVAGNLCDLCGQRW